MSNCSNKKSTLSDVIEAGITVDRLHQGYLDRIFTRIKGKNPHEMTLKLAAELEKDGYDAHKFLDGGIINAKIVKLWGKEADRAKLVIGIDAILQQNKGLTDLFENFLMV